MTNQLDPVKVTTRDGERITVHNMDRSQISMIDEALGSLGEFGEVRLVVEKGRLRFVVTQRSYDALKWQPGKIVE